jgi:hypothetical protein
MEELAVDLADFGARWNTDLYPLLNSLPRGSDETRWSGATNMPDPLVDGLDGDNIFVDNAASTTQDDGLFWNTTELRPKTVRESSRDIDDRVTDIYSELSESILGISNGLSTDQWNRLGTWVKDGTASLTTSVSYKAREGWDRLHILMTDIYESGSSSLGDLVATGFTLEEMITNLLSIHGGTWNTDTSSIDHSSVTGVLQASVSASASYVKRQRGYSPDANNLEEDVNRLRYEIARTRIGAAVTESTGQWNADVTDPVDSGVACLDDHVNYLGSGTISATNPHKQHFSDITGLSTELGYNNAFTGKSGLGSEMPTYSSALTVTQNASLETAIGELDAALNVASATGRVVYSFSGHVDPETPIVITHNKGIGGVLRSTYPIVQVVDTGIGGDYGVLIDEVYAYEQEHGIVTGDAFVSIEYIDANTFHVYTNVVNGKVIAVF